MTVESGKKKKNWFSILAQVGCVFGVLPCILAAIALPMFTRHNVRARQAECITNLRHWYTLQRTQQRGFMLPVDKVGFVASSGNRYAYFAGPGPLEERGDPEAQHRPDAVGYGVDVFKHKRADPITFEQLPPDVAGLVGLRGPQCPRGPDCSITLACAGNLDGDATLDVWSISTGDRPTEDGMTILAGALFNHVNDVNE